jgi:hypothetical protein
MYVCTYVRTYAYKQHKQHMYVRTYVCTYVHKDSNNIGKKTTYQKCCERFMFTEQNRYAYKQHMKSTYEYKQHMTKKQCASFLCSQNKTEKGRLSSSHKNLDETI